MVYLKHASDRQQVFIPRNRDNVGGLVFSIKNTINFTSMSIPVWNDLYDTYYQFVIELPADMPSGEYEYELKDDVGVISAGLLVVSSVSERKEYNKEVEYEQYE